MASAAKQYGGDQASLIDYLERIARQDREAFTVFYEATIDIVYRLAYRILRNEALAEEAVQEVYCQVWQEAIKYTPSKGKPLAWLNTICHRRCVERVRAEESRRRRENNYGFLQEVSSEIETSFAVNDALAQLNDKQKEALYLVYYEGFTAKAAAEMTSVPLPTFKSRLRDGLQRLKTSWKEEHNV